MRWLVVAGVLAGVVAVSAVTLWRRRRRASQLDEAYERLQAELRVQESVKRRKQAEEGRRAFEAAGGADRFGKPTDLTPGLRYTPWHAVYRDIPTQRAIYEGLASLNRGRSRHEDPPRPAAVPVRPVDTGPAAAEPESSGSARIVGWKTVMCVQQHGDEVTLEVRRLPIFAPPTPHEIETGLARLQALANEGEK